MTSNTVSDPSQRQGVAIPFDPLHRQAWRYGDQAFRRQRWLSLRHALAERSSASTRRKSSKEGAPGEALKTWNSRPWNGWTGSTTGGFLEESGIYRRRSLRIHFTETKNPTPWLPDSNKRAFGKNGAVHPVTCLGISFENDDAIKPLNCCKKSSEKVVNRR